MSFDIELVNSTLKANEIPIGAYFKRRHWEETLCVCRVDKYDWTYYKYGSNLHSSPSVSTLNNYKDFVLCDRNGNILSNKQQQQEEKEMSKNVNYIGGRYKLVSCTYEVNGAMLKSYIFKADCTLDIKENDLVVVESTYGFGLCRVLEIHEDNLDNADLAKIAKAWIVDKVNMESHNAKKIATERREYVLNKLEEKKAQMETLKMYALLAEMDPEAKELVTELKQLGL